MKKLIALTVAFAAFASPAFADGPLKSEMKALHVSVDENGQESLTLKEDVVPGDILEYALTYENTGEAALSGLIVSVPVPNATTYISDSAQTKTNAAFEVSIDEGANWQVPPVYKQTTSGKKLVPSSEYDLVRWSPKTSIDAGEVWNFTYRVKVE